MGFQEGRSKTGGRKKGTPNKASSKIVDVLRSHNFDPVADLVEWAQIAKKEYERSEEIYDAISDKRASLEMVPLSGTDAADWAKIGVKCVVDLLPYLYPKRKPLEGNDEPTEEDLSKLSTPELIDVAEQTIKTLKQ